MIFCCGGEVGKWQKETEWMDDGNKHFTCRHCDSFLLLLLITVDKPSTLPERLTIKSPQTLCAL